MLPWATWMAGCELEPNLGIHDYYQEKTREKLEEKSWLCFGENLVISDQDLEIITNKGNLTFHIKKTNFCKWLLKWDTGWSLQMSPFTVVT